MMAASTNLLIATFTVLIILLSWLAFWFIHVRRVSPKSMRMIMAMSSGYLVFLVIFEFLPTALSGTGVMALTSTIFYVLMGSLLVFAVDKILVTRLASVIVGGVSSGVFGKKIQATASTKELIDESSLPHVDLELHSCCQHQKTNSESHLKHRRRDVLSVFSLLTCLLICTFFDGISLGILGHVASDATLSTIIGMGLHIAAETTLTSLLMLEIVGVYGLALATSVFAVCAMLMGYFISGLGVKVFTDFPHFSLSLVSGIILFVVLFHLLPRFAQSWPERLLMGLGSVFFLLVHFTLHHH